MAKRKAKPSEIDAQGWKTINDLGQVRALAAPIRLKILSRMAEEPRTTKQVAEELGEPVTKLYHHVEALLKAGLIELIKTRAVRGTREKYFQAIATRFRVAEDLLTPGWGESERGKGAALLSILDTTRAEVAGHMAKVMAEGSEDCETLLAVRAVAACSEERAEEFRRRLTELVEWLEAEPKGGGDGAATAFALTAVFYPAE